MSYCIAWAKNNSVYIVAESAVSSLSNKIQTEFNTFGEVQGLYGKYYIQEGQLKIFKISETIVLGFAGNVDLANEIIEYIYLMIESENIYDLMKNIENTYSGTEIEIIIAILQQPNHNTIYHFDGITFNRSDKCEIGCGTDLHYFSNDIHNIIDELYTDGIDENRYLAMVLGAIQCYSLQNNTFEVGVGGTFAGVMMNTKIRWFRDLEYYIFEDDIKKGSSISIIARENSVFSASHVSKNFILNKFTDKPVWDNLYFRRSIIKSLDTKNAYYYIFYSKKYNVILFLTVNGQTQNIHFKRWIKREDGKTSYAYLFSPLFESYFKQMDASKVRLPTLTEVEVIKEPYLPHSKVYDYCEKNNLLIPDYKEMDFDFNEFNFTKYDKSIIQDVKKSIFNFHNLVLIDFSYFCDAISEKINAYKNFCIFTIDQLNLSAIVTAFMKQITSEEFDKYKIVVLKNKADDREILGNDMVDYFNKYSNCNVLESDNFIYDFKGTLFELMKNFYLNDKFFMLDKFVIVADNSEVNELLLEIVPEFNFSNTNPDIILVRNMNGLTNMFGSFRYIMIDVLIIKMLGLSMSEYGELDTLAYQ